jgi:hypothetical protein
MNTLILNRDGFQMPADGWYQIAPLGEFAHAQAGLVQVVDAEACAAMVNRFRADARGANFAGLLVDFDHFSLDGEKRSEAAGWITDLDNRDGGLFARIRWSDVGEDAVKGGRYRFLSPVWARGDCVDLGNGRVRPVRLLNAAVTNDPNLKGMRPLSNSAATAAAGGAQRFKWVLGNSPEGHCPSCAALAGQVRTMAEWQGIGAEPGTGGLYCQGNCHCSLEPTDDAASGSVNGVPVRKGGWKLMNGDGLFSSAEDEAAVDFLVNTGWTDEARAASLAARRAKAGQRKQQGGKAGGGKAQKKKAPPAEDVDYEEWFHEEGMGAMSPEDIDAFTEQLRQKLSKGEPLSYVEEGFLEERTDGGYAGESDGDPIYQWAEQKSERENRVQDVLGVDARDARGKVTDLEFRKQQGQKLSAEDESFVETYHDLMGNRAVEPSAHCPAGRAPEPGVRCPTGTEDLLANEWSDAARMASLAVRRAKATVRRDPDGTRHVVPLPPDDGKMYLGGTPYFDEKTGKYQEIVIPPTRPAPRGPDAPADPKRPKKPKPSPAPPTKGIPMPPPGYPRRPPPPGWKPPPGRNPPRM